MVLFISHRFSLTKSRKDLITAVDVPSDVE
jgi:hypothetical protein